jgi:hypothetical protein
MVVWWYGLVAAIGTAREGVGSAGNGFQRPLRAVPDTQC